ncbi:MAG: hypothetical protein BWY63_03367 [Chloroflexi bacterium ADurb.Bin360]|nr:MAG: hypothetical protein BWY63_03367 [Chloroflexi bacterium ADurb.Bin360]
MAGCRVAAGKGQRLQVYSTAHAIIVAHKPFPAPDCPVVTVTRAIQRHTDDGTTRARPTVICQTRGDMRPVMLHAQWRRQPVRAGKFYRKAGAQNVRMQVTYYPLWLNAKQMQISCQRGFVMLQGLKVLQVADVLTYKGVLVAGECERVLEQGSGSEHLPHLER